MATARLVILSDDHMGARNATTSRTDPGAANARAYATPTELVLPLMVRLSYHERGIHARLTS